MARLRVIRTELLREDRGQVRSHRAPFRRKTIRSEAAHGGNLALVVGRLKPRPWVGCPLVFEHVTTGREARRRLLDPGVLSRLDAFIVDDQLDDGDGLALISSLAEAAPQAIRVLLCQQAQVPATPDRLAKLALDDIWPSPGTGRRLVRKLIRLHPLLERTRAVHRRLHARTAELESLEGRYHHARLVRDRLARNVERALLDDQDRCDGMLGWWQGYREMLQHRVGLHPVAAQPLGLLGLLRQALERPEMQSWPFPMSLPGDLEVWLDPGLGNRMAYRLLRGLLEAAEPDGRVDWGPMRSRGRFTTIELRIEPVRSAVGNVTALLEDPFARMPDGPLSDFSIDLPLAHELLCSQGGRLEGVLTPPVLTIQWSLPRRPLDASHPLASPIAPMGSP